MYIADVTDTECVCVGNLSGINNESVLFQLLVECSKAEVFVRI